MIESTKMISKVCDNETFKEDEDGSIYCNQCSTQVEDIIQTGDGEIGDYRRKDTRRQPKPNQDTTKPSYDDYYKETRDRYVNGLLMMITYQCDTLVEKFNVTPLIIGLVGPISLRFVSLSGVFDDGWANKAILDSELQSQETKGAEEPENSYCKRAVMIWLSLLKKSLPLSSSLAISFFACHKAGASVLPNDIVRWARQGKIPYLSCFLKIRKQMGERSSSVCFVPPASIMFRPLQIVSAQRLEAQAASIADVIGLSLPPVNFYSIASNYLKRLSIREDKALLDLVCLIKNWSMPSDLYLSKNELRLPTRVCVMSIVIVAIRMLYKINGFGVWERSLDLVDVNELSDDMKDTEFDTEELLKNLETRYHEIIAETFEYEKGLLSYLSHGRNEIFAGLEEASADDTYRTVDNLWNSYPKDEDSERFETPSKRARDWEDDLSLNQVTLNDDELRDGNNPCTSHSRSSGTASMDCDEPSLECVSSNQEELSKERAIRRLITNMDENLFSYIPPRVKVKRLDYLQYVRKRKDGELIYAAHADYYTLLRVCALIAEIDVRNMHRGVLSFERKLNWIEKRIDHVLHLTPPCILSRDTKTST